MPKVLTTAQIEEQKSSGVEFITGVERRDVILDGMSDLLEQFRLVASATQAMVEKRNDDLIASIDRLAAAAGDKEEFGPMIQVLTDIMRNEKKPVVWEHEIERNEMRGTITKIRSAPIA